MEIVVVCTEDDIRRIVSEVVRDELSRSLAPLKHLYPAKEEVLLTRTEMAKFLRISLVTLGDWVKRGLPLHRKRNRGRVLFIKEEVLEWLRQNPELKYNRA